MAKIIEIPKEPIKASWIEQVDQVQALMAREKDLSFKEWIEIPLDKYAPFEKGSKAAYQAAKIFSTIEEANGTMHFEDADFEVVQKAAEEFKWVPAINRKAVPFWDALKNAQDVKK